MRVHVVDDDPTCEKLLDGLLKECQYQGGIPCIHPCSIEHQVTTPIYSYS
ncbi:hypothetical protein HanXRQr2_Chr03g0096611 [Helianthus annuus]|uniref:Response regulatory domain-containing protein n=1 Tax=Helianthus annuus TaxID=4232 RepID=A0A9K3JF06_HELAN|nr:hypothetical protein HanXRQr2_Chr03g0096611 [Helianthus annuus]KAJ0942538.1 hypothetical protein HanPSC8_Chr03g0093151 [Helianthus annuus]